MRGIALAIVVAGWGLELAIKREKTEDQPREQRVFGGLLAISCLVCIIFGV